MCETGRVLFVHLFIFVIMERQRFDGILFLLIFFVFSSHIVFICKKSEFQRFELWIYLGLYSSYTEFTFKLLMQCLCLYCFPFTEIHLIGLGLFGFLVLLFWQVSECLLVQTPAVPPGPCLPPRLQGRPKAKEIQLRWGNFPFWK